MVCFSPCIFVVLWALYGQCHDQLLPLCGVESVSSTTVCILFHGSFALGVMKSNDYILLGAC